MAFMLKLRWQIKAGQEAAFRANQQTLAAVMAEHPGVICYHADYPAANVSEWVEIYANDASFAAHLANEKGKAPLGALVAACDTISCRCWGDPSPASREILAGFGASYHDSGAHSYVLHPRADRHSPV